MLKLSTLATVAVLFASCGGEPVSQTSSASVFDDPAPITLTLNDADSTLLFDAIKLDPSSSPIGLTKELAGYGFKVTCTQPYTRMPTPPTCSVWAQKLQTRTNAILIYANEIQAYLGLEADKVNISQNVEFDAYVSEGGLRTNKLVGEEFEISCLVFARSQYVHHCAINVKK